MKPVPKHRGQFSKGRALPPQADIRLTERLFDELRQRTGTSQGITRTSYGLGEQIAHEIVRREACGIGMEASIDAGGNLYMRLRGARPGPAVFVGSHLDSVPLGGNFDGAAGVLAGLAVASGYYAAGVVPPQDLVIMAIRAEESTWFNASYIGSRAALGLLRRSELDDVRRASDQVTLGAAIDAAGGNSRNLRDGLAYLDPTQIACFIEPHIEQGPVLMAQGRPIGIVTGIRGSFRYRTARCIGTYAHSGATPRANRQDAVLATARLVTQLDDVWQRLLDDGQELTVTFGQSATVLGEAAFSKVAGQVDFSLDVRSQSHETLDLMRKELRQAVAQIEASHGVRFELGAETTSEPALMDRRVIANLTSLARAQGITPEIMPCGAGHDAAVFAKAGVPTGMIFIRNANGSHNPEEAMDISDFAVAAQILSAFCLQDLAQIS